jgi:hypothetical protein
MAQVRPYLQNNQNRKTWLKWQSTCLASVKPQIQTLVLLEKKKKKVSLKQRVLCLLPTGPLPSSGALTLMEDPSDRTLSSLKGSRFYAAGHV